VAVVGWDILNYYLQGHNPVDTWRGIPVLSRQEYEAGGKFAAAALGKYAYNELGGPIVYRMANSYERLNDDAISRALRAAPLNVFGSFIKITDQGYREDIRDIQQQITRKKARESLVLSALAERLVREPEKEPVLTAEEREALAALGVDRLMEKTKEKASKINTTWFAQAIKSAQGPEEKAAVLLYIMNWEKRYGQ
jgi:hypothetical protein